MENVERVIGLEACEVAVMFSVGTGVPKVYLVEESESVIDTFGGELLAVGAELGAEEVGIGEDMAHLLKL